MSLGTFIAGRYATTWNSVDVGITEQGYELQYEPKGELINESDAYGLTLIEIIYRGGDWSLIWAGLEYKAGSQGPINSYSGGVGALGTIAVLGSGKAQSLVMTATAGTPAAVSNGPATLTASGAVLSPASLSLLMNSKLRRVPTRMNLLPISGTTAFTVT